MVKCDNCGQTIRRPTGRVWTAHGLNHVCCSARCLLILIDDPSEYTLDEWEEWNRHTGR